MEESTQWAVAALDPFLEATDGQRAARKRTMPLIRLRERLCDLYRVEAIYAEIWP